MALWETDSDKAVLSSAISCVSLFGYSGNDAPVSGIRFLIFMEVAYFMQISCAGGREGIR